MGILLQIYGGGPAILRYNPSGVLPGISDPSVTFEGNGVRVGLIPPWESL